MAFSTTYINNFVWIFRGWFSWVRELQKQDILKQCVTHSNCESQHGHLFSLWAQSDAYTQSLPPNHYLKMNSKESLKSRHGFTARIGETFPSAHNNKRQHRKMAELDKKGGFLYVSQGTTSDLQRVLLRFPVFCRHTSYSHTFPR